MGGGGGTWAISLPVFTERQQAATEPGPVNSFHLAPRQLLRSCITVPLAGQTCSSFFPLVQQSELLMLPPLHTWLQTQNQ